MAKFRKCKAHIRRELSSDRWDERLDDIVALPPKETIGPLLALLPTGDVVKWRAVIALGLTVSRLADASMEEARVVMRRLLWHMNEESGNIGWGIAEAMAEIMANHSRLREEYAHILVSYVRETGKDDNYLEHGPLRGGVYWGIGRLARIEPRHMHMAVMPLLAALKEEEDQARGLVVWALCGLHNICDPAECIQVCTHLADMTGHGGRVELLVDRRVRHVTVGALVQEALRVFACADA